MKGIVVFGSEYGATEKYAKELAAQLNFDSMAARHFSSQAAEQYDVCIHGGGLYAGGVHGLKDTLKAIRHIPSIAFVLFTVGLADPRNNENVESIRKSLKKQLPPGLYDENRIFHLRGGIRYSQLNFTHKTMMTLLCKKAAKMPPEKQTEEIKAMLETFGQEVDFVDLGTLPPLVSCVHQLQLAEG